MKPLSSHAVLSPLYNFLQMAFAPDLDALKLEPLTTDAENRLFARLAGAPLTIKEALGMPSGDKRALSELLTQYVMFLTMFNDQRFAPNFLAGTSETTLGRPVLRYMADHRWPFPQMLPQ